ncbi:MAG TPA: RDD family protein [Candidatus Acidoferrum sp.]|nr:RDD family protein [Candidatus Acidoferrum sp.]
MIAPASPTTSAPPKDLRPEQRDDSFCRIATLGDRLIAFALDSVFLFGVFAVVDAWAFMRWGIVDGTELKLTLATLLVAEALNATIFFLYLWLLEASFGATLGKAMVGIRVVRTTGRTPLAVLAIRNLLRVVDGLGFYLVGAVVAGCSKVHRRLGDVCAGTVVIEEHFSYWVKLASIALWTAVLAGAVWSVPRICETNAALPSRYLNQVVVHVGRSEKSAYFTVASLHVEVQLTSASGR